LAVAGLCAVVTSISALGGSVTYEPDAKGRLKKATFSDGTVIEYSYDANGNRTSAVVTPGTDTTAPSIPTNLTATAASQSQVNLSWTASSDDVGVTGYRLERCAGSGCTNFSQIATPTSTSHSDTGLSPNTTYVYQVRATDGAGNLSAFSSSVSVTTPDTMAPSAPGTPSFSALTMTSATANWSAATDDVGVTGYQYRLNSGSWQSLGNVLSVALTGLSPAVSYTFEVRARDAANNFGATSTGTFTTPDTAAPSAPGTPTFSGITMTAATASWTAATDNVGVAGYDYKVNSGSWQSLGNVVSVSLNSLSAATSYTVSVRARDASGNLSPASSGTFATTDTSAPTTPTSLSASAPNSTTVNLIWTASTDNVGVSGYRIRRGGTQIGTSATTAYTDTTVSGSTAYSYTVSAYDAAGNASAQSSPANVTTPDTIPPSTPSGLSATAASATQVNLTWNASSDTGGSGLAGYRIYRNGAHISSTASASYSDTSASASTAYSYTVVAYDNANNLSGHSNTASLTTPAAVPTVPGITTQYGTNSSNFSVQWTVPSGPLSYYQLEVTVNSGTPSYLTLYPPQTSRGFQGGDTDWAFRIRACNASSQCSLWSNPVTWHTCPVSGCP
jgi:YD repeat-containing protein